MKQKIWILNFIDNPQDQEEAIEWIKYFSEVLNTSEKGTVLSIKAIEDTTPQIEPQPKQGNSNLNDTNANSTQIININNDNDQAQI